MDPRLTKVTLFHFNDFHRKLNPMKDGTGGAARLVGELRELKADNPGSVIINLGDVAGDNSVPGPDAFAPVADLFDRAQVDILTLGNHEFEDPTNGYQTLREGLIAPFDGEVLCANVQTPLGEKVKPYSIHQLAGINIAFIGVVTREVGSKMFPLAGAGLEMTNIEDELRQLVPRVRTEGADAVVVLAHEGIPEIKEMVADIPGIDVVLAAHDHQFLEHPQAFPRVDGGTTYITEAGAYGRYVNQLDLGFTADHKLVSVEGRAHLVDENSPSDPQAEEIVANSPDQETAKAPGKRKWKTIDLNDLLGSVSSRRA